MLRLPATPLPPPAAKPRPARVRHRYYSSSRGGLLADADRNPPAPHLPVAGLFLSGAHMFQPPTTEAAEVFQRILTAPRLRRRRARRRSSRRQPVAPAWATRCCSSARTCSRCSRFKLRGAYNKMAHLAGRSAGARRDLRLGRQPRPGRGAGGAAAGLPGGDRDAGDHARDQGRRRAPRWAARWCCTATASTTPAATPGSCERGAGPDLRPPLRRPGRDRRPGHDRHGDPAPASRGRSTRCSSPSAAAG